MSNSKKDDQDYWKTRSFEERAISETWINHLRETVDALGVKSVALADLKIKLMAAEYEIAERKRVMAEVEDRLNAFRKATPGAEFHHDDLKVLFIDIFKANRRSFDREENLIAPG